jgi:hypothetical protein
VADEPDLSCLSDAELAELEVQEYNRLHAAQDEHLQARRQITIIGAEMVRRYRRRNG